MIGSEFQFLQPFFSYTYTIIMALIALGILIVFHEFGHFIIAKKCGVGVLTFSVGFGPKLWTKVIAGTEYALSAFPLGGYVKMVGEDPGETLELNEVEQSFSHQGLAKRTAIVVAGPVFNLLLAVCIFVLLNIVLGAPTLSTKIGTVGSNSPADVAGLKKGDRILAVNGEPISEWRIIASRIRASKGKVLNLRIQRAEQDISIKIQPIEGEVRDEYGEKKNVWIIGITSAFSMEKIPPWVAVKKAFKKTGEYSTLTLVALYKMATGSLSTENLGGPILIAQIAGKQAREGVWSFLFFIAILSINLGVLNLLPIPVLDGGHLLFFVFEWILGHPVEIKHRERAQQVGIFILILVMIYAFYNDIARFF